MYIVALAPSPIAGPADTPHVPSLNIVALGAPKKLISAPTRAEASTGRIYGSPVRRPRLFYLNWGAECRVSPQAARSETGNRKVGNTAPQLRRQRNWKHHAAGGESTSHRSETEAFSSKLGRGMPSLAASCSVGDRQQGTWEHHALGGGPATVKLGTPRHS